MKEKIKNILQKKPIKIFVKVVTILTYIFTIVVIILLSVGSCSNNKQDYNDIEIRNVVTTPIKGILDYGNFYAYSFTDLYTDYSLFQCSNYLNNRFNTDNWSIDKQGTTNAQLLDSVNIDLTGVEMFTLSTKDSQTGKNVSLGVAKYVNFRNYYYIRGVTQDYDHRFEMRFFDNNDLMFCEIRWYVFHDRVTDDVEGTMYWAQSWYYPTHGSTSTSTKNPDMFFTTPQNDTLGAIFQDVNNVYDVAYQSGYDYGYEYGYQRGDIAGYGRGISENIDNNYTLFTIIQTGFTAVAGLLNLQILPNITLGLLIFTPLVVVIIIAIVKMIKG